jgi:hypothetical protein
MQDRHCCFSLFISHSLLVIVNLQLLAEQGAPVTACLRSWGRCPSLYDQHPSDLPVCHACQGSPEYLLILYRDGLLYVWTTISGSFTQAECQWHTTDHTTSASEEHVHTCIMATKPAAISIKSVAFLPHSRCCRMHGPGTLPPCQATGADISTHHHACALTYRSNPSKQPLARKAQHISTGIVMRVPDMQVSIRPTAITCPAKICYVPECLNVPLPGRTER